MTAKHLLIAGLLVGFGASGAGARSLVDDTGDVPAVTTDKRYARGATMAFGRMTVKSGTDPIAERGFCWAENPNPTIDDSKSTRYFDNNGRIYRLDSLKPATLYYMRAYAVTKTGKVGYGLSLIHISEPTRPY